MRAWLPLVVLVATACAAPQTRTSRTRRPELASLQSSRPVVPQAPDAEDLPRDASAGVYLDNAFRAFRDSDFGRSAKLFRGALATGELNDAGRALAYWHIHLAERQQHRNDVSVEALSSFVIVANDILEDRIDHEYSIEGDGDFVERFQLEPRLAQARALISAAWAERVPKFGRTIENPVPVHDPIEAGYFMSFASGCDAQSPAAKSERRREPHSSGLERVTLRCNAGATPTEYYFQYGLSLESK